MRKTTAATSLVALALLLLQISAPLGTALSPLNKQRQGRRLKGDKKQQSAKHSKKKAETKHGKKESNNNNNKYEYNEEDRLECLMQRDYNHDCVYGNETTVDGSYECVCGLSQLALKFGYDANDEQACAIQSDKEHVLCVYVLGYDEADNLLLPYSCDCEPTSNAVVFDLVDVNGNDRVTKQETLEYTETTPCIFPFTYQSYDGTIRTHNECTTVDEEYPWCATKVDSSGVYSFTHWKYCTSEGFENAWNEALEQVDENNDGEISFEEVMSLDLSVTSDSNRRLDEGTTDCYIAPEDIPAACRSGVLSTLLEYDCIERVKAAPLGDELLLRQLADMQQSVYCDVDPRGLDICPSSDIPPPPTLPLVDGGKPVDCHIFRAKEGGQPWFDLLGVGEYGENATKAARELAEQLNDTNDDGGRRLWTIWDGAEALKWSHYVITRGPHQGKTVLSFMGTNFWANPEQVFVDIFAAAPCAGKSAITQMTKEAVEVAEVLAPDFLTGHSLGGMITELVASEIGIPGAAFAPIGVIASSYSCNHLIQNVNHAGTNFEVIINENDLPVNNGLVLQSSRGTAHSHLACSSHVRWLDFPNKGMETTLGHGASMYATECTRKFKIGSSDDDATPFQSTIGTFLPDQQKNLPCSFCLADSYCESGKCVEDSWCSGPDEKMPTFCPLKNADGECERGLCKNNGQCSSGRCDGGVWTGECFDKLGDGEWCNEHNDCISLFLLPPPPSTLKPFTIKVVLLQRQKEKRGLLQ